MKNQKLNTSDLKRSYELADKNIYTLNNLLNKPDITPKKEAIYKELIKGFEVMRNNATFFVVKKGLPAEIEWVSGKTEYVAHRKLQELKKEFVWKKQK